MNPLLQYQFDRFEQDRKTLFAALNKCPDARINETGDSQHWSVGQLLVHLMAAEDLTLRYLKKKSLGADELADSGLFESVKLVVLKISQRLPLKYKAPEHLIANTPNVMSLSALATRWDSLRVEFRQFLETIQEHQIRKLIYKHPIAGRLDVVQCLVFLREHFNHHMPQIKRRCAGV